MFRKIISKEYSVKFSLMRAMYIQRRKFVFLANFFAEEQYNDLKNKELKATRLALFYTVRIYVKRPLGLLMPTMCSKIVMYVKTYVSMYTMWLNINAMKIIVHF